MRPAPGSLSVEWRIEPGLVDYEAAVSGSLQLVPNGEARAALAFDYEHMVGDGLLLEDAESFGLLIERCADIAEHANRAAG